MTSIPLQLLLSFNDCEEMLTKCFLEWESIESRTKIKSWKVFKKCGEPLGLFKNSQQRIGHLVSKLYGQITPSGGTQLTVNNEWVDEQLSAKIAYKLEKGKTLPRPTKFAKNWRNKALSSKTDRTAPPAGNDDGQEFVYGLHTLREILRAGTRSLLRLHVIRQDAQFAEIVGLARSQGVPIVIEPRERITHLVPQGNHQGIVGLVAAKSYTDEDDLLDQITHQNIPPLVLVLDSIQDPHNLGAILRSADAAGVQGVFIPKHRSVGLTSGVARASAGAIEYVQVARAGNTNRLLEKLQLANIMTYALDPTAKIPYTELDLESPAALVFGAEGQGIRPGVMKKCDIRATIPMIGRIGSLNLSVSVAVVLFEAMRQRREAVKGGGTPI